MNAVTKEESTALTLPERAAVALGAADYEVKIKAKVAASTDITAVIDPAGREQAHRIGMDLLKLRTGITAAGEAARKDATAFSKAVIAKEKELVALIAPEETRVMALRDDWDEKVAAEKAAKIAAERARTEAIANAIQAIRDIPMMAVGKSSADISALIGGLASREPDESFEEFIEQAQAARHESLDKLAKMETAQRAIEIEAESQRQEAARQALAAEESRKAEAARIEQERAALAAQRIENERIANEQAAERQRLAALAAAQEAEAARIREQAAANLKAERDAQELAMRLEREKVAKEQAERDRVAADTKRQLDEQAAQIAADRAALVRMQEEAAVRSIAAAKLEADHPEALAMNEQFDIDAAADLARCTATAQAMLTNGRSLVQADAEAMQFSVTAYEDAGLDDPDVTNEEIIDLGKEWGMDVAELVARLEAFCVFARAELLVAEVA